MQNGVEYLCKYFKDKCTNLRMYFNGEITEV